MHNSVIKAQEYRDRERNRRNINRQRREANEAKIDAGLDPAYTPPKISGERHRDRRAATRPQRQARRFFTNLSRLWFG